MYRQSPIDFTAIKAPSKRRKRNKNSTKAVSQLKHDKAMVSYRNTYSDLKSAEQSIIAKKFEVDDKTFLPVIQSRNGSVKNREKKSSTIHQPGKNINDIKSSGDLHIAVDAYPFSRYQRRRTENTLTNRNVCMLDSKFSAPKFVNQNSVRGSAKLKTSEFGNDTHVKSTSASLVSREEPRVVSKVKSI